MESSESQSKAVPSINKKLNFMFTKLACRVAFFFRQNLTCECYTGFKLTKQITEQGKLSKERKRKIETLPRTGRWL